MLGTLGLKILLIDEAATARPLKLREPADRAQQRFGNVSRLNGSPAPKDSRSPSGSRPTRPKGATCPRQKAGS